MGVRRKSAAHPGVCIRTLRPSCPCWTRNSRARYQPSPRRNSSGAPRSPLAADRYEEPRGASFWAAIDQVELGRTASKWWPDRGPSWDAIAIARRAGKPPTIVLIEAKANVAEFTGGAMAAKAPASIDMIERALENARDALRTNKPLSVWTGAHYQLANRIAWTLWLREEGIDAVFAYVVFDDDRSHIPATRDELVSEAHGGLEALGLSRSSGLYATVALPATR
jgi:hypothetical protein